MIRGTAQLTHTPIFDLGTAFRGVCPDQKCPELILPDKHPTVRGHQVAADLLWNYFAPGPKTNPSVGTTSASGSQPAIPDAGGLDRTAKQQEPAVSERGRDGDAPGAARE